MLVNSVPIFGPCHTLPRFFGIFLIPALVLYTFIFGERILEKYETNDIIDIL